MSPNHNDLPAPGFGTLAVHAGSPIDPTTGAVIAPINLSTTFAQHSPANPFGEHEYGRSSNPNRANFETAIAALEHAKYALAFSSGSAATAVILQSLPQSSHVISISDVYGGTHRYFTKVASAHGVSVSFTADIGTELESLLAQQKTALVWIESPSNPTLSLTDIRAVSETAHRHGAIVVVDNTFLSPYIQNPLDLGADIVSHSVTKYINGHSDVIMGVIAYNSPTLHPRLLFLQNAIGAVPSPFDCFLALRGLKTLHLRARQSSNSALSLAHFLSSNPHVLSVSYPGLKSHKNHHLVSTQHRDDLGGGMLSFRIHGGAEGAKRFASATRYFTLAESLGGVESLLEVPAVMTHAGIPKEDRERSGVYDDLIRLSVGVEDVEDLKRDLEVALESALGGKENGVNGSANGVKH